MSLLLDLYFPPGCLVDETFDEIAPRSHVANRETKLEVDARLLTRWYSDRASEAAAELERLFRFAAGIDGARWVFDRSSREGTSTGEIPLGDPDILQRMRDVVAGVHGYESGVVRLVVTRRP
ncbi:MAG: hypothetical protein R3B99_07300 [Polyangiales bacterium]|nr:hypothetical protein [Sandaracinus sp.]